MIDFDKWVKSIETSLLIFKYELKEMKDEAVIGI